MLLAITARSSPGQPGRGVDVTAPVSGGGQSHGNRLAPPIEGTFMFCRFTLRGLRCLNCGQPTGNIGTCADIDICPDCRKLADESPKEFAEMMIVFTEKVPVSEEKDYEVEMREERVQQ
jgi:hypothetical protein